MFISPATRRVHHNRTVQSRCRYCYNRYILEQILLGPGRVPSRADRGFFWCFVHRFGPTSGSGRSVLQCLRLRRVSVLRPSTRSFICRAHVRSTCNRHRESTPHSYSVQIIWPLEAASNHTRLRSASSVRLFSTPRTLGSIQRRLPSELQAKSSLF